MHRREAAAINRQQQKLNSPAGCGLSHWMPDRISRMGARNSHWCVSNHRLTFLAITPQDRRLTSYRSALWVNKENSAALAPATNSAGRAPLLCMLNPVCRHLPMVAPLRRKKNKTRVPAGGTAHSQMSLGMNRRHFLMTAGVAGATTGPAEEGSCGGEYSASARSAFGSAGSRGEKMRPTLRYAWPIARSRADGRGNLLVSLAQDAIRGAGEAGPLATSN